MASNTLCKVALSSLRKTYLHSHFICLLAFFTSIPFPFCASCCFRKRKKCWTFALRIWFQCKWKLEVFTVFSWYIVILELWAKDLDTKKKKKKDRERERNILHNYERIRTLETTTKRAKKKCSRIIKIFSFHPNRIFTNQQNAFKQSGLFEDEKSKRIKKRP